MQINLQMQQNNTIYMYYMQDWVQIYQKKCIKIYNYKIKEILREVAKKNVCMLYFDLT